MNNEQPVVVVPETLDPSNDALWLRIAEAIQSKGTTKQRPCAICSSRSWGIPRHFVTVAASNSPVRQQLVLGEPSPGIPFVLLICNECGNTLFVNLKNLGFSDDDLQTMEYR